MNNYYFSLTSGLGILLEEVSGKLKIGFKDKVEYLTLKDVINVPIDIIEKLKDESYDAFFNYYTIEKAQSYINDGSVLDYYLMGKSIIGNVLGNNMYKTTLTFSKSDIKSVCTCPVKDRCKHSYALLRKFKNDFDIVNKKYEVKEEIIKVEDTPKNAFSKYIKDYIINSNEQIRASLTKGLIKDLENCDSDDLVFLFNLVGKNYSSNNYSFIHLKRLIISNDKIFYKVRENEVRLRGNRFYNQMFSDYHQVRKYIDDINNKKFNNNSELDAKLEIAYFIDKTDDLVNDILTRAIHAKTYKFLALAISVSNIYEETIEKLIKLYNFNTFSRTQIKELLTKTNFDERLIDFFVDNNEFDIYDINLESLPKHIALKLIEYSPCNNTILNYLLDNLYQLVSADYKYAFKVIYKYYTYGFIKQNQIERIINLFPYNEYIYKLLKKELIDISTLDTKALSYFDIEIEYDDKDSLIYFNYNLYDYFGMATFNYNLELTNVDYILSHTFTNHFIIEVAKNYFNDEKNINELNKIRYEYTNREKIKLTSIYEKALNKFVKLEKPLNAKSYKAHLTLEIEKAKDILCEMKIGIDKDYIIKDPDEFLTQVEKKEYVVFGKSLAITLDPKNFDDKSRKVIDLLRSNYSFRGYTLNKRKRKIEAYSFEKLLEIYKNSELKIDSKYYYIRLDEVSFKANINDDYILNHNYDTFFIGDDKIYIKNGNFIDYLTPTDDYLAIKFLIENNGMNVSYVTDKFIEAIYYNYHHLIDLDPNISNDFKISELIINVYFDYDNKMIIKNEELYKDNILITKDDLDSNDLVKYNAYSNYLFNLGFYDNKLKEDDDIYKFFTMDFEELKKLANVYLSEDLKKKNIVKLSIPSITFRYKNNMTEAIMEGSIYTDEELYQVLNAIKKKKKYVILSENRIIDLNGEDVEDFYQMIDEFNFDMKHLNEVQIIPIYQSLKAVAYENNIKIDDYLKNMLDELTNFKEAKYPIPEISGKLRGYQKEGYNFLKILSKYNLGGILADDMGLGKTLEIITLIKSDINCESSLIICPKSLIFNWLSEFEKFASTEEVICIIGSQFDRERIIKNISKDKKCIYITSYDSLRNDINLYEEKEFNYVILDEAQYIKNVEAGKSKSVKRINGKHKFALTGTPIENNIVDLWSIFEFLMPGYFEDVREFKNRYLNDEDFTKKVAIKIAPFILRRTKKEVLKDLPPKIEQIISCDMTNEQRKIYDALRLEASNAIAKGVEAFAILPYLMRLRQICVDPKTFIDNFDGQSGKMVYLESLILDKINDGKRILIFSSFVKALNLIEKILSKNQIKYHLLTGDTSLDSRKEYVDSFNKNEDIKVFLISLKAGGTGLNLTGASVVIHMDPWWNVAAMDQATDRAHRIGQNKTVEVIKLVAEDSIEQRVIQLQNLKKELIDSLISNNDESITNFNYDDLKFLLE